MDIVTQTKRTQMMSGIRGTNTSPERRVRSMVHRLGYRFRLHVKALPGRPDLVLPRHRTVIMVHGCFWHRHKGCRFAYTPKSRVDFWQAKFNENVERDQRVQRKIRALGWRVIIVWECELKNPDRVRERLASLLKATDDNTRRPGPLRRGGHR